MTSSVAHRFVRLLIVLAGIVGASAALADYTFVSIDYPGAAFTQVFGINNSGQVTGTGFDADGNTVATFTYDSKKGGYTPITPAPGYFSTSVLGINEPGAMVGSVNLVSGGAANGFVRSKKGVYTIFLHPGCINTFARAISNTGLVSGYADTCPAPNTTVGFIYDPARNLYTDFLPSPSTIAQGISGSGQVVGSVILDAGVACTGCPAGRYGFLRAASGSVSYFRVNGQSTAARGISDSGLVTGAVGADGFVTTLQGLPYEAITIPASALLAFPGADSTIPEGISNAGAIVGIWNDADGNPHGFIATKK